MWLGLFLRPFADKLTFVPNSHGPAEHYDLVEGNGRPTTIRVHLGPPILQTDVSLLERDPDQPYSVMAPWIEEGIANVARRNLGRITASCISTWKTNEAPTAERFVRYYIGPNFDVAERDVAAMLTGLAHNYRHHRLNDKLNALRPFLQTLTAHLDGHGQQFADETLGPLPD
jgi:hypothetical protein